MLLLFHSDVDLCRTSSQRGRAASSGPLPVEKSRQGSGQGEEGLDHPSNQSAGEQQAGSRRPCPGKNGKLQRFTLEFRQWLTAVSFLV